MTGIGKGRGGSLPIPSWGRSLIKNDSKNWWSWTAFREKQDCYLNGAQGRMKIWGILLKNWQFLDGSSRPVHQAEGPSQAQCLVPLHSAHFHEVAPGTDLHISGIRLNLPGCRVSQEHPSFSKGPWVSRQISAAFLTSFSWSPTLEELLPRKGKEKEYLRAKFLPSLLHKKIGVSVLACIVGRSIWAWLCLK